MLCLLFPFRSLSPSQFDFDFKTFFLSLLCLLFDAMSFIYTICDDDDGMTIIGLRVMIAIMMMLKMMTINDQIK